jgi:hypothetical protein
MKWEQPGLLNALYGMFGWKFAQGRSQSMSSALARPYRQLFLSGKPIGRINHIFYKTHVWAREPSRVLGSFCLTPGRRLLFYPGLVERHVNWSYSKKAARSIRSTGLADHLTLEKGLQSWHLTILDPLNNKSTQLPSNMTVTTDNGAVFWFGLSLQRSSLLEVTPEKLTFSFPSSPRDSVRRACLARDARENAVLHLITLNNMSVKEGEFLHFDFFIGPDDLSVESLPCYRPTEGPIVQDYAQAFREGTHFRSHPVSIDGMTQKVWVIASKHVGRLSEEAIIGSS